MLILAILFDVLSFIPILNKFTNLVAAFVLGLVGAETGVSLYSQGKFMGTILVMLIEFFPFIGILPLWTIRVYVAQRNATE